MIHVDLWGAHKALQIAGRSRKHRERGGEMALIPAHYLHRVYLHPLAPCVVNALLVQFVVDANGSEIYLLQGMRTLDNILQGPSSPPHTHIDYSILFFLKIIKQ